MYKLNTDAVRDDLKQHSQKGGIEWFDLASDSGVFFYICPPFSERGRCLKHIQKVWLPEIKQNHTLFRNFQLSTQLDVATKTEVEIKDPVMEVINGTEDPKAYRIRTLAYANIIVVSQGKVGEKYTPEKPKAMVYGLPVAVGNKIMEHVLECPEILDPAQASPFLLEKTGSGLQTRYNLTLCGQASPKGFSREINNLAEEYGPDVVAMFDKPTDLDTIFRLSDKARDKAEEAAKKLEAALSKS